MRFLSAVLIAASACAQEPPPPEPPPGQTIAPPSDCTLDGTVVDQVTQAPVPRAKVAVRGPGVLKSAAADNSGHWSFTSLPCVNVEVDASRFGYLRNTETSERPLSVLLNSDSPAHVSVEILPQAVVTGKVLDENGDPVAARVISHFARVTEGKRVFGPAPMATADDIGQFRLAPLVPGNYIVCAEPATPEYQQSCYPGPLETGSSSAMKLSPGQESEVDFVLPVAKPVSVSGAVSGVPDSGATVYLLRAGGLGAGPGPSFGVSRDGKFTIPAVAPGSYILIARARGGDSTPMARMPLEAGSSDITGLALALEPPLEINGTLRVDSDNPPANMFGRFNVSLASSEPSLRATGAPDPRMVSARSNEDGRSFTIAGISPGTYSFRFRSDAYFLEAATFDGNDISHGDFTIDGPGSMNIVISDRGGSLDGDVILDDGSPATTATVILLRNREFARAVPVTNGHFNTRNLQPGDYTAYAWDSTRNVEYANPDWMSGYSGRGADFTITAGQDANVKLTRIAAPAEY